MVYPYSRDMQGLVDTMNAGNFGLWYNKMVPLNDFSSCKVSDKKGDYKNAVPYYFRQYQSFNKNAVRRLLEKKHTDQLQFCSSMSLKYQAVSIEAKLESPLITGIGESHPSEVSMVFDHNMGIPFIPASGIKGIARFAHTLGLLAEIPSDKIKPDKDGKLCFDDEEGWTRVPELFGTQEKRGSVVFLDAYPKSIPSLHLDIMNPHYGDYYSDRTPPADYLSPNPIKFLTVAKGTVFSFRALVLREVHGLVEETASAIKRALSEEGVGAKTALGYGRFDVPEEIEKIQSYKAPIETAEEKNLQAGSPVIKEEELALWENAHLTWSPGNAELTATSGKNRARTTGMDLVPEGYRAKLKKKKSAAVKSVLVEPMGNSYIIRKVT